MPGVAVPLPHAPGYAPAMEFAVLSQGCWQHVSYTLWLAGSSKGKKLLPQGGWLMSA
jgi:hypothetical protein